MAATFVEICNTALSLIGANSITALSDNTKEAKICNARYVACRKAVLRSFMWQFAISRQTLAPTFIAITTMADNGSGLIRVTKATHGLSTGNRVTIADTDGLTADGTYVITVIDVNNFDLVSSNWNGAFVSSTYTVAPTFGFSYKVTLPTGWLRLISVDTEDYKLEGNILMLNEDMVDVRVLLDVTDPTLFDVNFDEALAHYIAWSISIRLSDSATLRDELWKSYIATSRLAKFVGSVENPAPAVVNNDWIASRVGVNEGYVRDPGT